MTLNLDPIEIRILGCLIEKQLSTPDYYPLTLNSLVAACNQKSNREPVMNLSESDVQNALNNLVQKNLARKKQLPGSRALKYEHKLSDTLTKEYDFNKQQLAILSVLFVRGPQTVGELKARTQRMADFDSMQSVESCLNDLQTMQRGPYVKELPRQPGKRENRICHLFGDVASQVEPEMTHYESTTQDRSIDNSEIELLRVEIDELRNELAQVKQQLQMILESGK